MNISVWRRRLAECLALVVMILFVVVDNPTRANATTNGWNDPVPLGNPAAAWLASGCNGQTAYSAGLYHTGRDYWGELGAPVRSLGAGVVKANMDFGTGFARAVFVQHEAVDGTKFVALYGHVDSIITANTTVAAGEQIGTLALLTGTETHLHLGLVPGTSYPATSWGRLVCNQWPNTNGFTDPVAFLAAHPGSGGTSAPSDNYFHGTPPDNAVIENYDGGLHKYVALGGSLIYISETEYIWNYIHEMEVKILSGQFHVTVRMHNNDIHAIEYGFGGNRSHVPADGSFFYERGSQQQYVMRFGYAFPVNGMGELEYLGGVNRAVMVPPGTAQRLSGTPVIPNDVLFRALGPTLYHEVNGTGFWVPNTPTADCIRVAKHAEFRPVPDSLLANQQAAGRLSMQPTNCTFPHGQVLYGQPSGRQAIVLYGKGFAIGSPQEAAAIGAVNLAQPVADQTIDMLLGLASQVPDGHVFRAGLETAAYQYASGTLRPIDAPLLRDCLLVGGNLGSAEEVVPQSFIAAFAVGASASCQLDNRQLLGPDGASVGYIKDGTRHWVPNPAVRDCLAARSGTGQPVQASSLLWNSYSQGSNAYCPYHLEPGLNFVQEQGSPIVWLVGPAAGGAGMKRHAGSLCVPDPYTTPIKVAHVFMVPAGETAGLAQGADWWPTGADCQALPG